MDLILSSDKGEFIFQSRIGPIFDFENPNVEDVQATMKGRGDRSFLPKVDEVIFP